MSKSYNLDKLRPSDVTTTERFAQFQSEWLENPVQGVRDLFGAEPTLQQISLIKLAWKPHCRVAVSSCTGAGKTTVMAWLTFLFLLTQDDCRILVTSPSFNQLTRVYKTECEKWKGKMPKKYAKLFTITRERVTLDSEQRVQQADLVTANAENKENLQGGHAGNYVILADEASGIEPDSFATLQKTLSTGTGGRFVLTSNPTRAVGAFYDIFHKDLPQWSKLYFTAFDCPHIAPGFAKEMEDTYGLDSDHYRVGVLGQFPRTTNSQFISSDIVDSAMTTNLSYGVYRNYPITLGIDVARFGDDETVFVARQGPKILNITRHQKLDTMQVAEAALQFWRDHGGDVIFIDSIGIGAGVFDRCRQLKMPVKEVMGSRKSSKPMEYFNLRSQLWGEMKHWLMNEADIPDLDDLRSQLVGMSYGYTAKMQMALTTKKDMKRLGMKSPDLPDAISLTFAGEAYGQARVNVRARKVRKSTYNYV